MNMRKLYGTTMDARLYIFIIMSLKRKFLSISDKKKIIIRAVESDKKKKDVADSFQILLLTLSTILIHKHTI